MRFWGIGLKEYSQGKRLRIEVIFNSIILLIKTLLTINFLISMMEARGGGTIRNVNNLFLKNRDGVNPTLKKASLGHKLRCQKVTFHSNILGLHFLCGFM